MPALLIDNSDVRLKTENRYLLYKKLVYEVFPELRGDIVTDILHIYGLYDEFY